MEVRIKLKITPEKRKKIESLIYKVMSALDKTGQNTKKYKEIFEGMSDEKFSKWAIEFLSDPKKNFYLDIEPFNREPNMDDIIDAANILKIPLTEKIALPFVKGSSPENPVISQYEVPVGYVHVRRLQQMVYKKNAMSTDIENRDNKTGQVINHDKNARSSDVENYALMILDADKTAQELLGPRSDDMEMKKEMYGKIARDGYVSIDEIPSSTFNKKALNTLDVYFLCAGIKTDLVTQGLELPRTILAKKDVETLSKKYRNEE